MKSYLNPGPDSQLGEKVGERSEPRGNLGRRKQGYFTPFFAFFPHYGAWSQAKIRGNQRRFPPKCVENTFLDYPEYF